MSLVYDQNISSQLVRHKKNILQQQHQIVAAAKFCSNNIFLETTNFYLRKKSINEFQPLRHQYAINTSSIRHRYIINTPSILLGYVIDMPSIYHPPFPSVRNFLKIGHTSRNIQFNNV